MTPIRESRELDWEGNHMKPAQETPTPAADAPAQPQHSPLPSSWHDCEVAEKQIKDIQRERDQYKAHAEALAEALRLVEARSHVNPRRQLHR